MFLTKNNIKIGLLCLLLGFTLQCISQEKNNRKIHYVPDGESFILKNGSRKFNRALYGTNTGFRVEAGDLPEFALYMPGTGGNFQLGISTPLMSKWLTTSDTIATRYNPGTMLYEIKDALLGEGVIKIQVVAHAENEGIILKVDTENIPKNVTLFWMYGGASGKKFSRDGDIGADPESSFYLKPEYCVNNQYTLKEEGFLLNFGSENNRSKTGNDRHIVGYFPDSEIKLVEVNSEKKPQELFQSEARNLPVIMGKIELKTSDKLIWKLENTPKIAATSQAQLETEFNTALQAAKQIASRVILKTPDSYINTLGGALAIAGDAIWENPAYLHGAVAWRMPLNAWRGAFVATPLGWHDRAKTHFEAYGESQVLEPEFGPVVPDTLRNFARQKEVMGTSMFSSGYISRRPNNNTIAHHYDMNSGFINQVLRHYQWTGNLDFIQKMWPVIKRHIAWEKRNFDADNDGLYDGYATIWASDALQYSGGGVTYASAYNYTANLLAASIAKLLNENPEPYIAEAKYIKTAVETKLWVSEKGVFAEYKDLLGNQLVHDNPGLWTIYHSIDEQIGNAFQNYQSLRYVDTQIPHIPVKAEGLPFEGMELVSTTNWQPYTWSVNNVALAENLHTALAYWQGGRSEKAFNLWKSALVETMYLGASPGSFQQLSYYDAIRGELYRDFADPIGMAARSLVEGLFGIQPNAIKNTLVIKPGFPQKWKEASLELLDITFTFVEKDNVATYKITSKLPTEMSLYFSLDVFNEAIEYVKVNGKKVVWHLDASAIGKPKLIIESLYQKHYMIEVKKKGKFLEKPLFEFEGFEGDSKSFQTSKAKIISVYNPQAAISEVKKTNGQLDFTIQSKSGYKTFFIQLKQKDMMWWQPVHVHVKPKIDALAGFQNWDKKLPENSTFDRIDLNRIFNSKVTNIFEEKYLSPRATSSTLQLPTQGIGNWCYPFIKPTIDDSGLRQKAGENNMIISPQNIPFQTPSEASKNNIAFVSQWDNFPNSIEIPLSGKAKHAYFMLAGTTNPMQSRFVNGEIKITYTDGTIETLVLKNPENWWPIEQDYFIDGLAFTTSAPKPPRVHLKTGIITREFKDFKPIEGFSNFGIDGGAATLLDMPLNPNKTLERLEVKAIANEVVIGLMSMTLFRN